MKKKAIMWDEKINECMSSRPIPRFPQNPIISHKLVLSAEPSRVGGNAWKLMSSAFVALLLVRQPETMIGNAVSSELEVEG